MFRLERKFWSRNQNKTKFYYFNNLLFKFYFFCDNVDNIKKREKMFWTKSLNVYKSLLLTMLNNNVRFKYVHCFLSFKKWKWDWLIDWFRFARSFKRIIFYSFNFFEFDYYKSLALIFQIWNTDDKKRLWSDSYFFSNVNNFFRTYCRMTHCFELICLFVCKNGR